MAATAEDKIAGLRARPRLTGEILEESAEALVVRAGGCIVEIPLRSVADRIGTRDHVQLSLRENAEILVSTIVSAQEGFVVENVFGALNQGIFADNCNCNCNCNCGDRCVCNCNCNCDTKYEETVAPPVQVFRRRSIGGVEAIGGAAQERS
jgi:hypothetical protein